jgi:hypothetical protein
VQREVPLLPVEFDDAKDELGRAACASVVISRGDAAGRRQATALNPRFSHAPRALDTRQFAVVGDAQMAPAMPRVAIAAEDQAQLDAASAYSLLQGRRFC